MKELLDYLGSVVLPTIDSRPTPQLSEWNWPHIAKQLREKIAKAKEEAAQ